MPSENPSSPVIPNNPRKRVSDSNPSSSASSLGGDPPCKDSLSILTEISISLTSLIRPSHGDSTFHLNCLLRISWIFHVIARFLLMVPGGTDRGSRNGAICTTPTL